MRTISSILGLLLVAFIVWFTVSNQHSVYFALAQFDSLIKLAGFEIKSRIYLPAYIWGFIIFTIGFISGIVATGISGSRKRMKHRALKRELKEAKTSLGKLQDESRRHTGREDGSLLLAADKG